MRIHKRQHPLLHGLAAIATGGMSIPVSGAMMAGKASRNIQADAEARMIAGLPAKRTRPGKTPKRSPAEAAEFRRVHVPASKEYKAAHS